MILTHMPDLPPLPETARNAAFRREFYRAWGQGNWIICGNARHAEYDVFRQNLSVKCVAHGTETYYLDRRRLTVSDHTWLLLNEQREYGSVLHSERDAYSFAIFFRPGFAGEMAAVLAANPGMALDGGAELTPRCVEFGESLRSHDDRVTPVLRFIQRQVAAGVRDERWLEEQCAFLLERLITQQHRQRASLPEQLAASSVAKRAELARRLAWACDYMHANLRRDLTLDEIAGAAHLSRYHFLLLFRMMYGATPLAFLLDLRTRRALELLAGTSLTISEVASQVGLSRIALWRSLRAARGAGGRQLRSGLKPSADTFLRD